MIYYENKENNTPQTPLEILESAKALIEDEDNWIKGAMFCSESVGYSNEIDRDEFEHADKFCSLGALEKCSKNFGAKVTAMTFLGRASLELMADIGRHIVQNWGLPTAGPITAVNDRLGHKYVMQAYDMAIKEASGQNLISLEDSNDTCN